MGFGTREDIENLKRQLIQLPMVLGIGEFVDDDEVCLKLFFASQQIADAFEIPENDYGVIVTKAITVPHHAS